MASSYEGTRKLIYKEIVENLERKDDSRFRFAPRGTVKFLFRRDNHSLLRQLFRCLVPAGEIRSQGVNFIEDELVSRVESRKLFNFWGALVFAWCSIDAALAALHQLVMAESWPVFDVDERKLGLLPLSRSQLHELFQDHVEADKFFSHQACFCAVVLRNREEVIVQDASCQRLPYLKETLLGEGSFGKVYRVKVAKNHFFDAYAEAAKAYNGKPQYMARKDYIIADVNRAREEYAIMKKILSANFQKRENNIVQSWGCLQIETSYSLFMPVAICDLHAYMMEQNKKAPQELKNKADIVLSAAGLASGLNYLHSGMQTEELEELVCYHMDLNPSNVLVFNENNRHVWKLSDFGMSRVKMRKGQSSFRERDFNSLFVRRKKPQDPSLPSTENRRGEGTWLPPESISTAAVMNTAADIWALGCVLSVVFAYLDGGAAGVDDYADARGNHRRADGSDRFFLRAAHFKPPKVHPEIKSRHDKLITNAARRHNEERKAFFHILTFLQDSVLKVDQGKRCGAAAVKLELETTYRILQSAANDRRPSTIQAVSENFFQQQRQKLMPSKQDPVFRQDRAPAIFFVRRLQKLGYLAKREFTGLLYEYENRPLHIRIAFVYRRPCQQPAQPVELERNGLLSTESVLDETISYCIDNKQKCYIPEVTNIAISPDSKTLVFIMRNETNTRGPGSLAYASLPEMIAFIRQELRHNSERRDSHPQDVVRISRSQGLLHNVIKLDWPAADVEHLSVADTDNVYVVVRPELTGRTREHKIRIAHIWMDKSSVPACLTIDTLNVVSLGFDGSSTAGFFTTFCVVNDANSCALVTRGKRLHFQRFDADRPHADDQRDISHYRITKLFNSAPTSKLFAIGNISSKQQMMLLEVSLSPKLEVRELVKIPGLMLGDDVAAVAVDSNDKTLIIITALTGTSRRVVHKITVPKHR